MPYLNHNPLRIVAKVKIQYKYHILLFLCINAHCHLIPFVLLRLGYFADYTSLMHTPT